MINNILSLLFKLNGLNCAMHEKKAYNFVEIHSTFFFLCCLYVSRSFFLFTESDRENFSIWLMNKSNFSSYQPEKPQNFFFRIFPKTCLRAEKRKKVPRVRMTKKNCLQMKVSAVLGYVKICRFSPRTTAKKQRFKQYTLTSVWGWRVCVYVCGWNEYHELFSEM